MTPDARTAALGTTKPRRRAPPRAWTTHSMSSNANALRLFGVPRDSVEFSVPAQPEPEPEPEPEKTKKSTSLLRKRAVQTTSDDELYPGCTLGVRQTEYCVRAVAVILVLAVVVVWMAWLHTWH